MQSLFKEGDEESTILPIKLSYDIHTSSEKIILLIGTIDTLISLEQRNSRFPERNP